MIRAIIVDDEEKSRKLLQNLLTRYCTSVEVIHLAESVNDALAATRRMKPDLIFLDIVMPDENGFQLLEKLKDFDVEVIFTTAFDQFAIKAIRFSVLDYLLKPINIDELQAAVKRVEEKLLDKNRGNTLNEQLTMLQKNYQRNGNKKMIGLPTQSGINFVEIRNILMCKAEGNYSIIYFTDSHDKDIVTRTLKEFEDLLADFNFFRVHRSYLINLSHIKEYSRTNHSADFDGDGGCVMMMNSMRIPVSRDKRKLLLKRFARPF